MEARDHGRISVGATAPASPQDDRCRSGGHRADWPGPSTGWIKRVTTDTARQTVGHKV